MNFSDKKVRIGLAGLGTVGAVVAARLQAGAIAGATLTAVSARNPNAKRDINLDGVRFAADAIALATADDVDVVVELIGGQDGIALDLVRAALKAKKPVVTANKAMLAVHADELSLLSSGLASGLASGENAAPIPLAYEAAIAGGIPIVKLLREGLAGNQVLALGGILNGTCNYILSRMEEGDFSFDEALHEAQKAGFAEIDPSLDISGVDAAQKLSLLAAQAFDVRPDISRLQVQGIADMRAQDISFAAHFGYVVRLIAIAYKGATSHDNLFYMKVSPMLVRADAPLALIKHETNAVFVDASPVGRLVMQGAGAGGGATASAVLADIADITNGHGRAFFARPTSQMRESPHTAPPDTLWYLRMKLADKAGSMAQITKILAENGVSVQEVVQRSHNTDDSFLPIVFITHKASAEAIAKTIAAVADSAICTDILHLPVYEE